MVDIKTKELVNARAHSHTITDLDDRMRCGLMKPADCARNLADEGQVSSTEYASDQLQYATDGICYEAGHIVVGIVKNTSRSAHNINNHIGEHKKPDALDVTPQKHPKPTHTSNTHTMQKADGIIQQTAQSTGKATIKAAQKTIQDGQRALKASRGATKTSMKATQETARAVEKSARTAAATARRTSELLRETAKAAVNAAKVAAKATAAAAKSAAAAVEEIGAAIAAGGWVALVIIAAIIIILVIITAVIGYLDPFVAGPQ